MYVHVGGVRVVGYLLGARVGGYVLRGACRGIRVGGQCVGGGICEGVHVGEPEGGVCGGCQ